MIVREAGPEDRDAVAAFLKDRGSAGVARRRELVDAREYPALVAEEDGRLAGVLTYVIDGPGRLCEVITLHVAERGRGVGTALLANLERMAKAARSIACG